MSEASAWNGQFLGERVSLAVHADTATGTVLAIAKSESTDVLVYPDQFGGFLSTHVSAELVCYDAAQVHWALDGLLRRKNDQPGLRALWDFSAGSRLWDVSLLDQRLRLVTDGVCPLRKSLDKLITTYGHQEVSSADVMRLTASSGLQGKMPAVEDLTAQATAVMAVHQELHAQANQTARKLGIKEELVRSFGPLGTGIDVQGAIGTGLASRTGLCANPAAISEIEKAADEDYRRASEILAHDGHARRVFAWKGGLVEQGEDGSPKVDKTLLRKWLRHTFDDFRDRQNGLLTPPLDDDNDGISTTPEHWGVLLRYSRSLNAWGNLMAAARTKHWLRSINDCPVYPTYEVVPEIRSLAPDLKYLRSLGALFCPRPDHKFVVVNLTDLELRCFASRCGPVHGQRETCLARIFENGQDPIRHAAKELYARETTKNGKTVDVAFEDLRLIHPEAFFRWIKIARVLLFAVLRSVAAPQVRELLRQEVDDVFCEADARQLYECLPQEIYPELEMMESDTTFEALAKQFGVKEDRIFRAFNRIYDGLPEQVGSAVRNALSGKNANPRVWTVLRSLAHREKARQIIMPARGGLEAYGLLLQRPVSPSGQVGRPAYCTCRRSAEIGLLAGELRKRVAYELAASGYQLAAVAGDGFLLDAPAAQDVGAASSLVVSVVGRVLGDVANRCCTCQDVEDW